MRELTEEEYEKYLHEVEDRIIESDNPLPLEASLLGPDGKEASYAGYARVRLRRPEERNHDFNFGKIVFPRATGGSAQIDSVAILNKKGQELFTQRVSSFLLTTGMSFELEFKVTTSEC